MQYYKYVIFLVLVIASYFGAYHFGHNVAETEYNLKLKTQEIKILEKINTLVVTSNQLANQVETYNKTLGTDISAILKNSKKKPATIIIDNKCKPSEDYFNSYNEAIDRVNKK